MLQNCTEVRPFHSWRPQKLKSDYSKTVGFIRGRMQICVLRSESLCLRGQNGRSRWRCSSYSKIGVGLIWILWLFIISVPDGLTTISSCTRCINFFKKSSKNSSEPFPCTFLRWVPSVLIGPRHEVCAFDLPLHVHTYIHVRTHMQCANHTKPVYMYA